MSNETVALSTDKTNDLTKSVKLANSQTSNVRLKFLMEKLVDHLHDYTRETRLTIDEWKDAIQFLKECGHMSTDIRQEFILLSDILGLSVLVDSINKPTPPNATESTVLGPFYTNDAPDINNGDSIASSGKGEVCLVLATVKDTNGNPIEGAKIDVWETDGEGRYDNEYEMEDRPDMRGRLTSNSNGEFSFKCIKPVSYSVPDDGPVGKLLRKLNRHTYRPAHIHFRISVPNNLVYNELVTALYIRDDPYQSSDVVFGVKESLVVDVKKIQDSSLADKYKVTAEDWLIKYDFVLSTRDNA